MSSIRQVIRFVEMVLNLLDFYFKWFLRKKKKLSKKFLSSISKLVADEWSKSVSKLVQIN